MKQLHEFIESTFKLGQNRCQGDQAGMLAGLLQQDDPTAIELAKFMQDYYKYD